MFGAPSLAIALRHSSGLAHDSEITVRREPLPSQFENDESLNPKDERIPNHERRDSRAVGWGFFWEGEAPAEPCIPTAVSVGLGEEELGVRVARPPAPQDTLLDEPAVAPRTIRGSQSRSLQNSLRFATLTQIDKQSGSPG